MRDLSDIVRQNRELREAAKAKQKQDEYVASVNQKHKDLNN